MKPIIAQDQARLGLGRCVRLAVSGMSYRLLRSGITTAILALAVAFLVHVLTHAILAERVQRSAWDELRPTRESTRWLTRLAEPDAPVEIQANLAGGDRWKQLRVIEYGTWWTDHHALSQATQAAEALKEIQTWADALTPAQDAVILGGLSLGPWLAQLQTQSERRFKFESMLDDLQLQAPLGTIDVFNNFLQSQWTVLQDATDEIRTHHRLAIERFREADGRPILERFAQPSATLEQEINDAPFVMPSDTRSDLESFAAYQQTLSWLQRELLKPEVQQQVNAEWGPSDFSIVINRLARPSGARWWEQAIDEPAWGETVYATAKRFTQSEAYYTVTENYQPVDRNTPFGLPVGTLWLVGLSLLVCVVGVTNALLMSVTERFNEIATMKCLGAMDRSIMQMFVAEAVIQGVLGGTVGVVLGLLLTLLRGFAEFGTLLGRGLGDWPQLLAAAGLSLGLGVLLAAFAAIGPSWVASRLAPMEAMRVE